MSICLAMIVKNESHCISECLESVKPFIDYWVICDTGSTDNTEEIVKKCLKDIPGEFHKHDWLNFAANRNKALQLARKKSKYTLMMDADDYLEADKAAFDNLKALIYRIKISHGNLDHYRPQLIHNSVHAYYVGVIHEYLELPYVPQEILPNCRIVVRPLGYRSLDPEKYIKDALTLETAIRKEPDNPRYVFYCAQSYRDCGDTGNALKYYMMRTEMEGFYEEKYCSYLEAGKILERLRPDDMQNITITYLKGHQTNPSRVECLCYLAMYYRKKGLLAGTYAFAKMGSTIRKPTDALFLEPDCYDWQIWDELAVSAYYTGRKDEATALNRKLVNMSGLPDDARSRIIMNLEFCEGKR